jgi:mannose-6-phosphate isomerase-like protein (cupin superfamily)
MQSPAVHSAERLRSRVLEHLSWLEDVQPDVVAEFRLRLQDLNGVPGSVELRLPKPYGQNDILRLANVKVGLSTATILPGRGTSTHFHHVRKEVFCVIEGELQLCVDGTRYRLGEGDMGYSEPLVPHSLHNLSQRPARIVELFSPADLDDKVRLQDRYGRALGKVRRGE